MNSIPASASRALARQLVDIAGVVESIDDETFGGVREDGVSGSIGAHVRHALDHVAALIEPRHHPVIDYDSRRRGTPVERHRPSAAAELRRFAFRLHGMSADEEARVVAVSSVIDTQGQRVTSPSTMGRELVFVLSHTIHHQAIIALLLASAGQRTPDRFGVAPSTPDHRPCAQSA